MELAAQIIGIFGTVTAILSFQCRSSKRLFLMQGLCALFFSIHFGMLGAMTGLIQNLFAILRAALLRTDRKWAQSKWIPCAFSVVFLMTAVVFYDGFFSLLPPVAMIVSTFVMWTKNGKFIRLAQLGCVSPFWMIYNISVHSISGCITEGFNIMSILISILRYGINGFDHDGGLSLNPKHTRM